MTASPFDSAHLHRLFAPGDMARLFSDSADIRAQMIVLGALARVQGEAGVIPDLSGRAIHRASLELQIDPSGLAARVAAEGATAPALAQAFRDLMQAPDHARYVMTGAAPAHVQDSALMLRLRQVLAQMEAALDALLGRDLPAGARAALQAQKDGLPALRDGALWVSLPDAALRPALAAALGLRDPGCDWTADRSPLRHVAGWAATLAGALCPLARPDDPVRAAALQALAAQAAALLPLLDAPDAAMAQPAEWLALPQILLCAGAALGHAEALAA